VVQTDIHHPTDNTLLWDVVRIVTRLVRRLGKALELRRIKGFSRSHAFGAAADELAICPGLLLVALPRRHPLDLVHSTAEKIYSIFEPHTDLIKRGKVRTPIEFGHKVFLAESAQGLITQYEVLKGNPSDEIHVAPSLDRHMEAFGRVPELYGSDRGFFSEQNIASCAREGVKVVCIPQRGGKKTPEREAYEKSADFKQGQRFRAGIEGRISVLFRGRGMKRCLAEGHERFELWVAAAVLANNLMNIAALLTRRASRRRKAI
jgi:IS5 family transposase